MQYTVSKSKFCIPAKDTGVFISQRMDALQRRITEYDIVTISAPSGYGKTTFAYISSVNFIHAGYKAYWYQIDKQDGELSVFFSNLITAVFSGEIISDELQSYLTNQLEIEEKKYNLAALFCQALWDLDHKYGHSGIILYIDDFHLAGDNENILQVVNYISRYAPPGFKLFIVSRKKHELQTDVQIKKRVLELGPEDLLLSKIETADFIDSMYDLKIEDTFKKIIYKKTSGWIAGVILLSRLVDSNNRKALNGMLEKDIPQEEIFRYIAHEILDNADNRFKNFLVKIVILSEFTLKEATEILEMDDTGVLLGLCEKQGFLIQKNLGTGTVYSFHALFQGAITSIQEEFISKSEIRAVALRAAGYYYDLDIFKTVEYYIKCGEVGQALEIVENCSKQYILINKINYARRWLGVLDEEYVNRSSALLFLKALITQHSHPDTAAALLESAFRIASDKKDIMLQLRTTIALMHVYSLKGDTGNVTKTFFKFPVSSIVRNFKTLRTVISVIALGKAAYEDNIKSGLSHLLSLDRQELKLTTESFETDVKAGNRLDRDFYWAYLGYSGMIHFRLGSLDKVEATIRKALELPDINEGIENYYILQYSIIVKYFRRDTNSVWKLINELLEKSEINENDYFTAHCYLYLSRLKHEENDYEKAADYAQLAVKYYLAVDNPSSALNAALEKCLFISDSRKFTPLGILEQAEDTIQSLSKDGSEDEINEKCLSVYALLMMEAGNYEKAEKALLKCIRVSEAKKTRLSLCSTLLILGKLYYRKQEKEKCLYYLEKAFGIACTEGYSVFENMHFHTMVLAVLVAYNHNLYTGYAKDLIEGWFGTDALNFFVENAGNSKWDYYENFSDFFIENFMKRNIGSNKVPNIKINTLGHFCIVVNGIEIQAAEWKTRKNQAVLKYLLLNTGVCVPREKIAGVLWPEADKKSSSASLRVALSEIRKTLGKFGVSNETKEPLLDETIDGLAININPSVKVDFLELANIYNVYYSLSYMNQKGEMGKSVLESAVALYKGEFLSEDQYEDWTTVKRDQLRSMFVKLSLLLTDIYMNNENYEEAETLLYKVLNADMYSEEACKRIVRIYVNTGRRGRAMQFLSDFINRYNREFDELPPKELLDLIGI